MKLGILACLLIISVLFVNGSAAFNPVECDLCQLSVDTLAYIVKADNDSYTQIYDAVDRVCESIPATYTNLCLSLLKYSGPTIISQIMNGTNSNTICGEVQICTPSNYISRQTRQLCFYQNIVNNIPTSAFRGCSDSLVCNSLIKYINHMVEELDGIEGLEEKCQ